MIRNVGRSCTLCCHLAYVGTRMALIRVGQDLSASQHGVSIKKSRLWTRPSARGFYKEVGSFSVKVPSVTCPLEVVVADNPPRKHGLMPDFPGLQKFDCYEIKMVSFNPVRCKKKTNCAHQVLHYYRGQRPIRMQVERK